MNWWETEIGPPLSKVLSPVGGIQTYALGSRCVGGDEISSGTGMGAPCIPARQ